MWAVLPIIESRLVSYIVNVTLILCRAEVLTSCRMFLTISQWIYFLSKGDVTMDLWRS